MAPVSLQEGNISMVTKEKILLVDGDEGIRKSLELFFGPRDYHFHAVENATQAIMALKKERYDIIICDELLPDMNGLLFFNIINNRCFEAIKILVTLYGNNTTSQDIDHLITKPFSGNEIEAAVTGLIKERQIKKVSHKQKQ